MKLKNEESRRVITVLKFIYIYEPTIDRANIIIYK